MRSHFALNLFRIYHAFVLRRVVVVNFLKRLFLRRVGNKFLFILAPPYSGSTLLNELLSTSRSVSVNNPITSREGQMLPGVRDVMRRDPWTDGVDFDWGFVKRKWLRYWDVTVPILLEKSPPNIMRASSLGKHFSPAYFIVLIRNPYALCEGYIRRNQWTAIQAAEFVLRVFRYQKMNAETLPNVIRIAYEELTENPGVVVKSLSGHLHELSDIKTDKHFRAHNFRGERLKIGNLNDSKIGKLSSEQKVDINRIFKEERELLAYFGYDAL